MATKAQAKTAVDNAATAIKADIDNIPPANVNIVDGKITFNPTTWTIQFTVVDLASAQSLSSSIQTALTGAGRTFTLEQPLGRRNSDAGGSKAIVIYTALCIYRITGF